MFIDASGEIDFPSYEHYRNTERIQEKVDNKNPPNKRKKCLIIIIVISVIIILAVGIFLAIYFSLKKEEKGGSITISSIAPKQGTYKILNENNKIKDDDFEVNRKSDNKGRLLDTPISDKSGNNYKGLSQGVNTFTITFKKTLTSMEGMFANIQELKYVDFSELNSKKIVNINNLFLNCSNLEEINFQNFDSKKLETMDNSFENCSKLTLLDLSSFSTPKLYSMNSAFKGCSNLIRLNLDNFIFDSKINLDDVIEGCDSLLKVDLPGDNKDIIKPTQDINNFEQCTEQQLNVDNICSKCEQKNIGNDLNISICISCPEKYFLNEFSIYPLKCNRCSENCISCDTEYHCLECEKDKYELGDDNKCVKKIDYIEPTDNIMNTDETDNVKLF